jgi:hypothetical protein
MTSTSDGPKQNPRTGEPAIPADEGAATVGDGSAGPLYEQAGLAPRGRSRTRLATALVANEKKTAPPPAPAPAVSALKTSWPILLSGLPALVTLLALMFSLFPWLEPVPPPDVRGVSVSELVLGERNKDLGDGRVAHSVFFEVETVGYDAEDIAVDWLVYDAQTRERLREFSEPARWGVIDINTRSDRVVGEIDVPPPAEHSGCVFVRVVLSPATTGAIPTDPTSARLLLDVADTNPFDPFDAFNEACPSNNPAEGAPA